MPTPGPFVLPPAAFEDLATVAQLVDKLPDLLSVTSALEAAPNLDGAIRTVANALELSVDRAGRLVKAVLAFHSFRREFNLPAKDAVDLLTSCLAHHVPENWNAEDTNRWIAASPSVVQLLDPDNPLAVHEKTIRLTFAHDNLLERTVIYTDIRPIFSESATRVLRASVSHVLQLSFFDGTHRRQISIALDDGDLTTLRQQCERAQSKVATIMDTFRSSLPLFVPGTNDAPTD